MDAKTDLRSFWVEAKKAESLKLLNIHPNPNGSSSCEIAFHEVGLILSFQFFWRNELMCQVAYLWMPWLIMFIFKLLPIVQVHDTTEYFPLGNCEPVIALKHKHKQNLKHCGLSLKLVFLPQCKAILPIEKILLHWWGLTQFRGVRQAICANYENHQIPAISTSRSFEVVSPPVPTPEGCCLHIYSSLVLFSCMSLWASCD